MSKESEPQRKKLRPGDPGYVGRGHTPVNTRIQPGEVRNPYGRAGKPKPQQYGDDYDEEMAWLLSQPIPTRDGKKISQAQLVHTTLLNEASKGNMRALALFSEMQEKYARRRAAAQVAVETDERRQQLIEEAMARRQAQQAFAAQPEDPDGLEPAEDDSSDVEEGGA